MKAALSALDPAVLQQCMRCGLCLPSCPTYLETGRERNSPRGRIALMRAVADGGLGRTRAFAEEMNYCLGCLACVSACPAGVDYATLLETARAEAEASRALASPGRDLARRLVLRTLFTRPRLLRAVGRLLHALQRWPVPPGLRGLAARAPRFARRHSDRLIAAAEKPRGETRRRVALLTGCVQDVAFSDVNRATADVLLENGCAVATPRAQGCCGSLHAHQGDPATARALARRLIDAIPADDFDAIVSNAAGCGSHLKRYGRLLADDPAYAGRAARWAGQVKDISEWLAEIGFRPPVRGAGAQAVAYQDACHLCHGQGISEPPRAILRALPGTELRECAEPGLCCGSAGAYSLTHPATAERLLQRKLGHLRATGASVLATANPGCHAQIESGLRRAGDRATRVAHPVVLLAEAYRAEKK